MRSLLFSSLLAVSVAAGAEPVLDPEVKITAGKAKYASVCAFCHGAVGEGSDIFPAVAGLSAERASELLLRYRDGKGEGENAAIMHRAAAPLTDGEIRQLALFLGELGEDSAVEVSYETRTEPLPAVASATRSASGVSALSGDVQRGGAQFQELCARCHGAAGEGRGEMFPKVAGLDEQTAREWMTLYRDQIERGPFSGMMFVIAYPLSDQDIADLSAYLAQMGGHAE